MKGLFIPGITAEMFRNGCLESIEALMAEGEIYDIECDPSAQRWIPCSEKLPEVGKKILVTSYGRVCYAVMISADGHSGYPIFRLQDSSKEKTVYETIAHDDMTSNRVIAWMPIPEPWRGEQDG